MEIGWHDATAQAELIASGRASAAEVVAAAIDRAKLLAALGATTVLFEERAARRTPLAQGPFAGVPILLKDAGQQLEGTPYWLGTRALKAVGYHSTATTLLAGQLEDLGFVIIGKAAVPELMTGVTTEPPNGPPTRNPWDQRLTVGGSSGGSAAAVAAGIVAIAHGSDSTGSLRYPASCCGIFSLKPTAGRVASQLPADLDNPSGMHVDFVLSRSVRDLQGILGNLSPSEHRPADHQPATVRRIGVLDRMPFGLDAVQEVHLAIDEVVDLLSDDHQIESVQPDLFERYGTVLGTRVPTLVDAHRARVVAWIEQRIGRAATDEDLSADILEAAARGRTLGQSEIESAREAIRAAAEEAAQWTRTLDALLLPILDVVPWPIGGPGPDGQLAGLLCSLANFSGQPSVAIPTVQRGLPVGVQLEGHHGSDEQLLDVVSAIRPTAPRPPNGVTC